SCRWEKPNRERRSPSHTPPPVTTVAKTRTDSLFENDLLNQEVSKLQKQIQSLKQKSEMKDVGNQKLRKNIKEATTLAADESSKHKAMLEIFESTIIQLHNKARNGVEVAPQGLGRNSSWLLL
ncbi:hypothetical protein S83_066710, partial [Arachis hypogaea]